MPKPRGAQRQQYNGGTSSGSRFQALNDYQNEHDDRDNTVRKKEGNSTRRVSFKPLSFHKTLLKPRMAEAVRTRLEDDEDMDGLVTHSTGYEDRRALRRKGSPIPKGKFGQSRKLDISQFGWYQVTVSEGNTFIYKTKEN